MSIVRNGSYVAVGPSKDKCPPRKPFKKILWSWLGAFLGIFLIAFLGRFLDNISTFDQLFLIGSFGASAVLVYGAPLAEFSQPRNLIGGHILSAIIGVSICKITPAQLMLPLSSAFAVSLSIFFMHLTRTLHPPGGATALIAIIGSQKVKDIGYFYIFSPVAIGALIMLIVALLVNNLSTNPKRHYPLYWY